MRPVTVAGAHDRDIVHAGGRVRQQVGHVDACFAVFFERPFGAHQEGLVGDELILGLAELGGTLLPVQLVEQGLGIERFDVARPARHEQEDHRLGFGRILRGLRGQRVPRGCLKHRGERQRAEAAERIGQKLAAVACRSGVLSH